MDYKKHLTKGKWIHYYSETDKRWKVKSTNIIARVYSESDAQLIAEAGTVCNECGKTPRELLDLVNELSERLKEYRAMIGCVGYAIGKHEAILLYDKSEETLKKISG